MFHQGLCQLGSLPVLGGGAGTVHTALTQPLITDPGIFGSRVSWSQLLCGHIPKKGWRYRVIFYNAFGEGTPQPATAHSALGDLGFSCRCQVGPAPAALGMVRGGKSWPEPVENPLAGTGSLLLCLGTGPSPVQPPNAMPALRGPHLSLPRCSLSLWPALITSQALLMIHLRILAQRGGVTQLTASQVLPRGSCTCRPLPVTGRRRQPAPRRAVPGNQS